MALDRYRSLNTETQNGGENGGENGAENQPGMGAQRDSWTSGAPSAPDAETHVQAQANSPQAGHGTKYYGESANGTDMGREQEKSLLADNCHDSSTSVAPWSPQRERASWWRRHVGTTWAICRWNLWLVARRRLFWVLIALGLLNFLTHFALIYAKAQIEVRSPWAAKMLDRFVVTGTGEAYIQFLRVQSRGLIILLIYGGVVVVVSDYRAGGVAFYLARPIGQFHYLLGKWLAFVIISGAVTLLPTLVLFLEYGFFSQSLEYYWTHPNILRGIVVYSLLMMTVPALLLLALGAYCRKVASMVMGWCAFTIALPLFAILLRILFNDRRWLLLDFWQGLRILGEISFGHESMAQRLSNDLGTESATTVAVLITLISALSIAATAALSRQLRAVEVIE